MSIADTDQAVKLGRIANVDAMIYGSVYVAENVEVNRSSIPTPYGSIPVTTRRYQSTAAINFTMDDIHTTKTICSVTVMRKYDSKDKADKKKYKKYKNNMPAITTLMIQECVAEFISKVSPHQVVISVRLEKGKSKTPRTIMERCSTWACAMKHWAKWTKLTQVIPKRYD